ncbi:MAG TPA: ABC transporter substrate-binding protein [Acidimicrobiia bacterium]|jgi:ABC-type branched-subunit amino acid transport system substrate-binding protein
MKVRRLIAVFAVLALVAAACGDDDGGADDTTAAPTTSGATSAPTTEPTGTTTPPTTDAPPDGLAYDVGFDEASGTISLGVLAAAPGGPIPDIGQSVLDGHRVYWDKVNAEGGVAGQYPVELEVRDNEYSADVSVVVYNEIKDGVLAFSSTLGTPTTAAIFEDAATANILIAAGSLASQWALTSNVILNLAADTYFAQFSNGAYWAAEVADPAVITADSVVGIVYQADDYGADCKGGYDLAQTNLSFNAAYEATYAATDTDFSAQIGGAQAAGVDVLFVCALPTALATMIGTAAAIQYAPAVFGSSPSYNVALPGALGGGDEAAGVGLFNSFPYYNLGTSAPWESDEPGMVTMREDRDTYGADVPDGNINAFFYFGYTQAATFHQILETAVANGDITRAGLLAAVDATTGIDLGVGLGVGGYGPTPQERVPVNATGIGTITSVSERAFGIEPLGEPVEAPWLADWDPAGG